MGWVELSRLIVSCKRCPPHHSGSGKSSLLALIQRLYDPLSGRVLVDGLDIKSYDLTRLRQQMAVVSQVGGFQDGGRGWVGWGRWACGVLPAD